MRNEIIENSQKLKDILKDDLKIIREKRLGKPRKLLKSVSGGLSLRANFQNSKTVYECVTLFEIEAGSSIKIINRLSSEASSLIEIIKIRI